MNKKFKEYMNGIGMVLTAVAMMLVGIGLIYLTHFVFHAAFK